MFFQEARQWCRGRMWLVRLLILVWFGWILAHHLQDPEYRSLFGGLNLGIHELGHVVFMPLGEFMAAAGGTVLQCLIPLIGLGMFYRQNDFFGIAFAFGWLSTNLFETATYVADARLMQLPLVSISGGDSIHDWNYLLGELGLLQQDDTLAMILRGAGLILMLVSLAFGGWLVWQMIRLRQAKD